MERHIILSLILAAIMIPTLVLSAPRLLDQLIDANIDVADFANEEHVLARREADMTEGKEVDEEELRVRRSNNRCVNNCFICIQAFTRDAIKLGDCIRGCTAQYSTKFIVNPLEAQSWSKCNTNYVLS